MHDPDGAQSPVRPSRTRARATPPAGSSHERPAGRAVRSALDVAKERWGTPIGPVTRPDDPAVGQPSGGPAMRRDPLAALRIWSEPSPSMTAIWADLIDGARLQAVYGWAWLVPYWLFGVPAFATACAARLLLDSSARPGRFAVLLLAVLLSIAGFYVAGLI